MCVCRQHPTGKPCSCMQVFIVMLREPQEDDEMHCIIAYNPYVCTYMHTQLRMHVCTYMYVMVMMTTSTTTTTMMIKMRRRRSSKSEGRSIDHHATRRWDEWGGFTWPSLQTIILDYTCPWSYVCTHVDLHTYMKVRVCIHMHIRICMYMQVSIYHIMLNHTMQVKIYRAFCFWIFPKGGYS